MPISSKKKRKAATAVPQPASTVPFPDVSVGAEDRAALAGEYVPSLFLSGGFGGGGPGFRFFGGADCFTLKPK